MKLTIGKLAQASNVNIETIRYYQRIGLLEEPSKPFHGYREYSSTYIARIHFIKRAQQLGFKLKEIEALLSLGEGHCDDVRMLAERIKARIEAQIKDLYSIDNALSQLIDACLKEHSTEHCSIIDALSDTIDKSS